MPTMAMMMTGEPTKNTASDSNPTPTQTPAAVFHDFLGGKAPIFPAVSLPLSEKQAGSQLERISSYGPKSDLSVSEVSNRFVGSKRSHSDSGFTGSSREGIPQMIPESSHVMKMLRCASGGDRLKFSPFDGPLHGVPQNIRPLSSFVSQTTNANFVNSERLNPTNVGGSSMQYNACVMKSSPLMYQAPSSRLRDISSGPSVLSQLAADEGSRTGNKGSGIFNSITAGSNPVTERNPYGLLPSGCNIKPATHISDPEPSNPPILRGLNTSGSRQMTIIYGGQVHVFDDVNPNKADVIMAMAGSNGGSWSTNLPKASPRTTTNEYCLPSGEHETNPPADRSFVQKYRNLLSVGANSIHGLGPINQGGMIAKHAGTSATEPSLETKREV
ncbi:protein TIFY 8-like isoform X2 [Chenopodium quinoa]|uniref:protein TIFY 8-like isoform X2 n=1 Tax=Chenopodium quinoa TaxID=63459 RepID=UPI000B76F89E|nr:protein TIFY 8-like isoform X2 [Chenopodium quinoa]